MKETILQKESRLPWMEKCMICNGLYIAEYLDIEELPIGIYDIVQTIKKIGKKGLCVDCIPIMKN